MSTLKAAGLYFALVFSAGWILGPIRELWVIPLVGKTAGLLVEAPLMLLVMIIAARWMIGRLCVPYELKVRVAIGLVALGMLLVAEFVGVWWVRRLSLADYLARFNAVTGGITILSFLLFAAMPVLVKRQ